MNWLLLCISHLGAFLLGGVTWAAVTMREGNRMLGNETRRRAVVPAWVVILLVGSAVLVGLGVQQALYQRAADDQAACTEDWGRAVTDSLDARVHASTRLERAKERRVEAVVQVVRVVSGLREVPPTAGDLDLDTALAAVRVTDDRVDRLSAKVARTRVQNPYPVLNCR